MIFCLFSSLLLTPLVYLTIPATSNAAAWTQGEGNGQAIFSIDSYRTSHSLDKDFNPTTSTNKFSKYAFNPYIEYGLTNDITIGASPLLQDWHSKRAGITTGGQTFESEFFSAKNYWNQAMQFFLYNHLLKLLAYQSAAL